MPPSPKSGGLDSLNDSSVNGNPMSEDILRRNMATDCHSPAARKERLEEKRKTRIDLLQTVMDRRGSAEGKNREAWEQALLRKRAQAEAALQQQRMNTTKEQMKEIARQLSEVAERWM